MKSNARRAPHGVLNLLKPPGMTSHDAVAHVRRTLGTKRVGHTGTLDPAAAGVLPICVGLATRLVESLQMGGKSYLAEATFGYETDTLDAVGQTVRECDASALDLETLERVCQDFVGVIEQEPPLHSAIKVGGQKLYDVARAGGAIEVPLRTVAISQVEVRRFWPGQTPRAFLRVECGGGTYIRSLVRDIGRAAGRNMNGAAEGAATMTFLTRTRSGDFSIENAITPQELEALTSGRASGAAPPLLGLDAILTQLFGAPRQNDELARALMQGRRVEFQPESGAQTPTQNERALVCDDARQLWIIAAPVADIRGQYQPEKVFDLRAQ